MLRDKTVIWLLLSYMLFQLAALFPGIGLFFFGYIVTYIIAITHSAIRSSKTLTRENISKTAASALIWYFIANLVLFLVYLPTLIYNPDINWKLKGEVEQDPMILQAYVPIIFFRLSCYNRYPDIINYKVRFAVQGKKDAPETVSQKHQIRLSVIAGCASIRFNVIVEGHHHALILAIQSPENQSSPFSAASFHARVRNKTGPALVFQSKHPLNRNVRQRAGIRVV